MRIYDYSTVHQSKFVKKIKRFWRKLDKKKAGTWLFRIAAIGVLLIALLFIYVSRSLPDPNRLLGRDVPQSTKIYDRNGGLLYEVHGEVKRTLVNLDQISPDLQNATVAIEDKDFYKHGGISITGTLRSAFVDITHGSLKQGGSTITQQFVKNAVLTKEKSLWRKIKEVILSIEIDARFSKKDVLKLYLNEIPYGRNAYGTEAAAQAYFGIHANQLSLAQSAYLAALPQAPTYYSPTGLHLDALQSRQRLVLQRMKDQGYINDDQYQKAVDEKVNFIPVTNSISAPHFVMYVQDYLAQKYGEIKLEQGGLQVYTTLDPNLQKTAEDAVKAGVEKFSKKYSANNAALVAVDPKTGQVLAMVGSKDYFGDPTPAGCTPGKNCTFEGNVNVATALRQPGSSFKPYVYVTAFGKDFGYSPASMLVDVTTNFGTFGGKAYIPHNYSGQSYGPLSMRQTLAGSLNVPAVKTLALVGVDNATQTAHNLGITSPLQNCGLSLVLGGCEVTLLDHTAAFAALANEGDKHDKTPIMKIVDQNGKTLEEYKDKGRRVIDPQAAYELISIMTDNNARSFIFGSSSPLAYSRPVGCKTGTTQNWHDGWTLCFTPSIAIGVWSGNNDGELLKPGADGVLVAAPIVNQVMNAYLKDKAVEEFRVPDGITKVTVDSLSGKLPGNGTPSTKTETFADYAVPTEHDNIHQERNFDRTTGLPATDATPPENIENRPCLNLHSEKPNDPNWENPVLGWAASHGGCSGSSSTQNENAPKVSITTPLDNATITHLPFTIMVTASSPNPITKVESSVDGQGVGSADSTPYEFTIRQIDDGQHTITAKATDSQGVTGSMSIDVVVAVNGEPLQITDPSGGEILTLPAQITAQSGVKYKSVTFYYQLGNGAPKTIGASNSQGTGGGIYEYTVVWNDNPKTGSYKIFAKSNSDVTSGKVTVIVGP
jgi:1A family penicillin-binding protein